MSNDLGFNDFIFTEPEKKTTKQKRESPPFPPTIIDYESEEKDANWPKKDLTNQVKDTVRVLKQKTLRSEKQVFCVLGSNVSAKSPQISQVLHKLRAEIKTFYDEKHSKILVEVSDEALTKMTEAELPKYFKNFLGMIRPLSIEDQISPKFKESFKQAEKFVMIKIVPNISDEKLEKYYQMVTGFLSENNRKIYGEFLKQEGLVFTESDFGTIETLLEKSDFVYRVSRVPEGTAKKLKTSKKKAIRAIPQSLTAVTSKYLPIVTVMDTGVNEIKPLSNLLVDRSAFNSMNFDDELDDLGHGTPIACLCSYGEERKIPSSKIISFKIWSPSDPATSFLGIIHGIKKYKDQSRIFTSSIGFPDAELEDVYELDRVIQRENIVFICSAGNIEVTNINTEINSGNKYPNYLKKYEVIAPGNALSAIAVGSIAKNLTSKGIHPSSIVKEGEISPYSCCGTTNNIFECKKPDFVENGSNLNFVGNTVTTDGLNGLTSYTRDGQLSSQFFGTSFSSPLLVRKFAEILFKYGNQIQNVETLKAIFAISAKKNSSLCSGLGTPRSFTKCDQDHALFLSEGTIPLFDKTEKGHTTIYSDQIRVKVPNSTIGKITVCIVHSDDYRWGRVPSLSTIISVEARKTGSDSIIQPTNPDDVIKKTNVKILNYSFERKSMEAIWRFRLIPNIIKKLPGDYVKKINVRYGCAILLSRKPNERGKYSVTRQVKAVR